MRRLNFFLLTVIIISAASCSSDEIGNSKDVSPDTIYQQYSITYNESESSADIFVQFRFGGSKGTTLVLNEPSSIQFDGTMIKVDSGGYKGAFYRTTHSMGHFSNQHQFVFTDINNKKYENELQFKNMQLINPPKTFSTTKSLQLSFDSSSCKPGDEITIGTMGSDSSFSESHTISVNDYSVTIPVADLQKQKGKDLWLDISISRDIPLKQNTKEGGKMNLEYKMKPLKLKKG